MLDVEYTDSAVPSKIGVEAVSGKYRRQYLSDRQCFSSRKRFEGQRAVKIEHNVPAKHVANC